MFIDPGSRRSRGRTMKRIILAAVMAALLSGGAAHAAITQTSGVQVSSPSLFNGFEGMPPFDGFFYAGPYSEGGITVEYMGDDNYIWNATKAFEGERSWYKAPGGGFGFTAITRTDGGDFSSISFAASAGFGGGTLRLFYQVVNDGVVLLDSSTGPVEPYNSGWNIYGFTGGAFDEVRLQVQKGGVGFDTSSFEAGIYDSIRANGAVVPEPASWAMMIVGIAGVGAALRRWPRTAIA